MRPNVAGVWGAGAGAGAAVARAAREEPKRRFLSNIFGRVVCRVFR